MRTQFIKESDSYISVTQAWHIYNNAYSKDI